MKRACFILKIEPGTETAYDELHHRMSNDLLAAIRQSGMRNYTLFRSGSDVIGYVEADPDFVTAREMLEARLEFQDWARGFSGIFADSEDGSASLVELQEIWHVD